MALHIIHTLTPREDSPGNQDVNTSWSDGLAMENVAGILEMTAKSLRQRLVTEAATAQLISPDGQTLVSANGHGPDVEPRGVLEDGESMPENQTKGSNHEE